LSIVSIQRTKEAKALIAAEQRMMHEYKERTAQLQERLDAMGFSEDMLKPETAKRLDQLVELGIALNVDPMRATYFDIAEALSNQIDEEYELKLQLCESGNLEKSLKKDLSRLRAMRSLLEKVQRDEQDDNIDEKMSEWSRDIKQLEAIADEDESKTKNMKVHPISLI
jgi:hypothetical protein